MLLRYYLFGSRRDGYGLEIVQIEDGISVRERCEQISRSRREVERLGREVMRGAVLVGYLRDTVSEWR